MGDATPQEVRVTLQMPPLDVIPSTMDLSGADLEMANYELGRERLISYVYRLFVADIVKQRFQML